MFVFVAPEHGYPSSMAAIQERNAHLYSSSQSILLVGEGDFTFSSDLADALGSARNIVASSLDSRDEVVRKYASAGAALAKLRRLGATVHHGLDATQMKQGGVLGSRKFDRIIFNFPHSGVMFDGGETNPLMIIAHKALMEKFFQNVGKRLNPGGEVHLTHKDVYPYTKWNLEGHAAACGLHLLRKLPFSLPHLRHQFPTYCNRRGYGRRPNRTFPVKCDTFTFVFSKQDSGSYKSAPSATLVWAPKLS